MLPKTAETRGDFLKKWCWLAVIAALWLVRGGEELKDVCLVETLAVDGSDEVTVTALGDEEEPKTYQATGKDVMEAQAGLAALGDKRVSVTHVGHLLLGPEVDVEQTLWRELECRESGYGAKVWACRGEAAAVLENGEDVSARLKALEERGGVDAPDLVDAVRALREDGVARLPMIEVQGSQPVPAGYIEVGQREDEDNDQ